MTFRDSKIIFTSDVYEEPKSLCNYYRDGYIIDRERGKVYLTVGFNYELEPSYIFIDKQITENGYHEYAETIEL